MYCFTHTQQLEVIYATRVDSTCARKSSQDVPSGPLHVVLGVTSGYLLGEWFYERRTIHLFVPCDCVLVVLPVHAGVP
jgi:hypothetical protein